MNKRIISFSLAMLMIISVLFTGCAQLGGGDATDIADDLAEQQSETAETLSMYIVSAAPVSEETARIVENAFNVITKAKFKTQVKLHFATYDEYYEVVEGVIETNLANALLEDEADKALRAAKKEAKALGIDTDAAWLDKFYADHPEYAPFRETEELTGDDTTAEQTEMVTIEGTDTVMSQIKYPEERTAQIDILWIDKYDRYLEYIEKEWLSRIDDELTSSSKKLNEYVNNTLLAWAKWAGDGTYAIPNNVVIGEYTYLLVNKELANKYSYDGSTLNSITSCSDFLKDIATYEADVIPVLGDLDVTRTFFWSADTTTGKIDSNKFSIIGNTYNLNRGLDPTVNTNAAIGAKNIFTATDYVNQLYAIQQYKDAGYISSDLNTDKQYAIRMIKGSGEIMSEYSDDYYVNILEYPTIGYDEVFGNMLAVSAYTRSVPRSMKIITYLNTNSELRNVLQYGVEGVHYQINEETGVLTRLNNDYMMDINATGNVFMAHPEEGMDPNSWDNWGKQQNLDAKSYLALCFNVEQSKLVLPEGADPAETVLLNIEQLEELAAFSKDVEEKLAAVKSYDELYTLIEGTLNEETGTRNPDGWNDYTSTALKTHTSLIEESGLYFTYFSWLSDTQLYVPQD